MQSRPISLIYDATDDVWVVPPPRQGSPFSYSLAAFADDAGTIAALLALGAVAYTFLAI